MKSIVFKSFSLNQEQYTNLLGELHAFRYDVENGEGVQILEESSNYVKCVYCYEAIYSQNTYNPNTDDFEKTDSKRIELIPFIIDLQYQTLDILGNKQRCTRIVEVVGKLSKFKIPITEIQVNPVKILLSCTKTGIPYRVNKVRISDYIFFDNIVGNCVLNLANYEKTENLLNKYQKQITSLSAILILEDTYSITFYKSGAISIYKDFEDIDIELIRLLKNGL